MSRDLKKYSLYYYDLDEFELNSLARATMNSPKRKGVCILLSITDYKWLTLVRAPWVDASLWSVNSGLGMVQLG